MREALLLAERGAWTVTPNPLVGCVIVRNNQNIASAWHQKTGEAHAEVLALARLPEGGARGTDVYVTLEPCAHQGHTPPCVDALIKAQVARVIIPHLDPDPRVSGYGVAALRRCGIQVKVGVCKAEARYINRGFLSRLERHRPWATLKLATSLDAKLALYHGESRWITSEASRVDVHEQRAASCAVLTGLGTVLHDDPELTVRHVDVDRQPIRILLDTALNVPSMARICDAQVADTWIITQEQDKNKHQPFLEKGVDILVLDSVHDWDCVGQMLAQKGINRLMIEAGPQIISSLEQAQWVDEYLWYYAPIFLGPGARHVDVGIPLERLSDAPRLQRKQVTCLEGDLRVLLTRAQEEG